MDYRNLNFIQNTYPNVDSYKKNIGGSIRLDGLYPEKNYLDFDIPSWDKIIPIEGTTFRFVLIVKDSAADDEPKYYTSVPFYTDMELSLIDNNPYFLKQALNETLYVTVVLDKQIELFNSLKLLDFAVGVKQYNNIFVGIPDDVNPEGNVIDYESLVRYIDWVVSPINPLDYDNNGVLPTSKVAVYEIGEYDKDTGQFVSRAELTIRRKLEDLYDELDATNDAIGQITSELREPQLKKTTLLEGIMVGLSVFTVLKSASTGIKALNSASKANKALALRSSAKTIPLDRTPPTIGDTPSFASKLTGQPSAISPAAAVTFQNAGVAVGQTITPITDKVAAASAKTQAAIQNAKNTTNTLVNRIKEGVSNTKSKLNKVVDFTQSIAGTAIKEVGKTIVKTAVNAISKQFAQKALTIVSGPIGQAVLAAANITKFFIQKGEEKKRFEAEKKEYSLTKNQLERLYKRKEEIETEIDGILTGKITLDVPPLVDTQLTATQRYLKDYGKKVMERTVTSNG